MATTAAANYTSPTQVSQAQATVNEVQSTAAKGAPIEQLDQVKQDVDDLKSNATVMALNLQETQKAAREQTESPLALHFKGVTITPGGYMAFENVYRNRALGADINTPFNSINFPGSGQNALSEFYASGRQSRISMLAEGKIGEVKLSGYVEADFLSAGVTSNNNQSNSYTLRQRQIWGQGSYHDWTITGGQMWSLVTETKKGLDNRTEAPPMTIDAQYTAGFSWARQAGFRVVRNFNNHIWLGVSLENPSATVAVRGNASNFALGGPGNPGGLYNSTANYSFNATPDLIVKVAFEPGFGHYELFAVGSRFRDRVYPCAEPPLGGCNGNPPSAQSAYVSSRNGAGFGANARITLMKQLDIGVHAFGGNGVGRYGTTGLPDATVNADGTLALLRSYQVLGTLEWHTPRFDWYMNAGEEYLGKHWQIDPVSLKPVGYGSPLICHIGLLHRAAASFRKWILVRPPPELQRGYSANPGRHGGILVTPTQRSKRTNSVRPAILLREPYRMGGHRRNPERYREHGDDVFPLLPSVISRPAPSDMEALAFSGKWTLPRLHRCFSS